MAIELTFSKGENVPWGFRLTGGAEYEVPLTVIKVAAGSAAESAGLQVGDVVIRINNASIPELTHEQAHDAIMRAGNDFVMEISRSELSEMQSALISEEESNEEVFNILEGSIPIDYPERPYVEEEHKDPTPQPPATMYSTFANHELNLTDEEIQSVINPEKVEQPQKTAERKEGKQVEAESEIVQTIEARQEHEREVIAKSEVLKAIRSSAMLSEEEIQERTWSTFLQKPKGPALAPKLTPEEEQMKKTKYRVVIRTKKDLEAERAAKKAEEEAAIAAELAAIEAAERAEREAIEAALRAEREAEELSAREAARLEEEEFLRAERQCQQAEEEENNRREPEEEEDEGKHDGEGSTGSTPRLTGELVALSLEKQLAQVKEQLFALTELPSTIQMTLNVITQQLQQIVKETQPHDEEAENELSCAENTDTEEDITELVVLESQEILSVVDEESENIRGESSQDEFMEEQQVVTQSEDELTAEQEERARILREEEELRRIEQEKIDKKEKEMSEERIRLPLVRPIILPGGRKWSEPDDASRSVRQPKMSDDKIDQTISSYYEVISGKTIGINFLKYQPPPKNLDHLMKSDVYKMVHDMDPPPRGIIARPEKILAEDDYFVKNEDNQICPQMER